MVIMMESFSPQSQRPLRSFLHVYLSQLASSSLAPSYGLYNTLPQSQSPGVGCTVPNLGLLDCLKYIRLTKLTLNPVGLWSLYHHDINKKTKSALAKANLHRF